MTKIALRIRVCADDLAAESAIKASNVQVSPNRKLKHFFLYDFLVCIDPQNNVSVLQLPYCFLSGTLRSKRSKQTQTDKN